MFYNNGENSLLGRCHEFLKVQFRNPRKTRIVLVLIHLLWKIGVV
ncbi:hypothetical protein H5410_046633 [Solanum commersonii]|uniref:Uncharacterized protein n=1 Tax=Solanum commersonii TaxID=4109 RepID=A0A9J5XEZ2_SOLCO|nr:hypothetical protein H5410_046633 [Solanum commersonii]